MQVFRYSWFIAAFWCLVMVAGVAFSLCFVLLALGAALPFDTWRWERLLPVLGWLASALAVLQLAGVGLSYLRRCRATRIIVDDQALTLALPELSSPARLPWSEIRRLTHSRTSVHPRMDIYRIYSSTHYYSLGRNNAPRLSALMTAVSTRSGLAVEEERNV